MRLLTPIATALHITESRLPRVWPLQRWAFIFDERGICGRPENPLAISGTLPTNQSALKQIEPFHRVRRFDHPKALQHPFSGKHADL